jgi:hypothetical protein
MGFTVACLKMASLYPIGVTEETPGSRNHDNRNFNRVSPGILTTKAKFLMPED